MSVRRTCTALPVQLNLRVKRTFALENWSGMLAIPLLGSPVTLAKPRTAPLVQRCWATLGLWIRSPTAKADPPSAKNSATSAIAVPGVNERRLRLM